jgi:hypothetical protein
VRGKRGVEMRVLIAYEERHHLYSDALEDFMRRSRPHISVINVPLEGIADQLERFAPHLVVSSESNIVDPSGMAAWIELSPEPAEPSKFCLDGEHSEASNLGLVSCLRSSMRRRSWSRWGGPTLRVARGAGCLYSRTA